jgi:hypothetical protein
MSPVSQLSHTTRCWAVRAGSSHRTADSFSGCATSTGWQLLPCCSWIWPWLPVLTGRAWLISVLSVRAFMIASVTCMRECVLQIVFSFLADCDLADCQQVFLQQKFRLKIIHDDTVIQMDLHTYAFASCKRKLYSCADKLANTHTHVDFFSQLHHVLHPTFVKFFVFTHMQYQRSVCVCVYIYIYIYIYTCTCVPHA